MLHLEKWSECLSLNSSSIRPPLIHPFIKVFPWLYPTSCNKPMVMSTMIDAGFSEVQNIWHIFFFKSVLSYLNVQKLLLKFYQGWIKCQHSFWNSINLQRFHHSCQIEGCRIYRWEVWCIHRSHCSSPFLAVSHPTHRPVWFVSLPCPVPWKLNQQLLLYMHKTFAKHLKG